jgi:hypothetical protein
MLGLDQVVDRAAVVDAGEQAADRVVGAAVGSADAVVEEAVAVVDKVDQAGRTLTGAVLIMAGMLASAIGDGNSSGSQVRSLRIFKIRR